MIYYEREQNTGKSTLGGQIGVAGFAACYLVPFVNNFSKTGNFQSFLAGFVSARSSYSLRISDTPFFLPPMF